MALPLYLAMTAAEMCHDPEFPPRLGYMACHFSPYGTGLSNCPQALPEGAMLILNDRTPICGHDPRRIAGQLTELVERFGCRCVLLDFQRPGVEETAALAKALVEALPCPVGVSDLYAKELDCPVFLPPVPLDVPLAAHIAPCQGREIWLETALDGMTITVTPDGSSISPSNQPSSGGHADERLHCHYTIDAAENAARFNLFRTPEDLKTLLAEAEALGITRAVGLWQEFNCQESFLT